MQQYLFIDRDGTLIEGPPPGGQIDSFDKLHFYPFVITWLHKIVSELPFKLVMVSNQNGLGTDVFTYDMFLPTQNFMIDVFKSEGIHFEEIIIDESLPEQQSNLRKPRIGRMGKYLNNPNIALQNSFVIGDRLTDVQFAKNLNCKAFWLNPDNVRGLAELTDTVDELKNNWISVASKNWEDIYNFLKTYQKL